MFIQYGLGWPRVAASTLTLLEAQLAEIDATLEPVTPGDVITGRSR